MGTDESPSGIEKGDHYQHPDGTSELVYAVEDGVVLTIREYPGSDTFRRAVDGADYVGVHIGIASLSDATSANDQER